MMSRQPSLRSLVRQSSIGSIDSTSTRTPNPSLKTANPSLKTPDPSLKSPNPSLALIRPNPSFKKIHIPQMIGGGSEAEAETIKAVSGCKYDVVKFVLVLLCF
jgi:hypothetical protein